METCVRAQIWAGRHTGTRRGTRVMRDGPGHGHADTCHAGSRVTGQQHAVMGDNGDVTRCCCMHSLFSSLAHTTSSFSSRIISTSRRCDPLVLYLYMVIADL